MGSGWDTATLLSFWRKQQDLSSIFPASAGPTWLNIEHRLSKAVKQTVHGYGPWAQVKLNKDGKEMATIPSKLLQEPSNIAHSAFLILTTLGGLRLRIIDPNSCETPVNALVNGILSMESHRTGSFAIHYGSGDTLHGIEFYPGEALLSLLDAFEYYEANGSGVITTPTSDEILPAAKRAFLFYHKYFREGNVDARYTSFYGNWQVQCFAKLYDVLSKQERQNQTHDGSKAQPTQTEEQTTSQVRSDDVAKYIFELCDAIVDSGSWDQLRKQHFKSLATVEVACGLEALADGAKVALDSSPDVQQNEQVAKYWPNIIKAVDFLQRVQDQAPASGIGRGGLGHGLNLSEQRLDVTGHAINALVKVYGLQKRIEFGGDDGVNLAKSP